MDYARCAGCGTIVFIAKSAKRGRRVLLETEPDAGYGNVLVDGFGRAHFFRDADAADEYVAEHPDDDVAMSNHYVPHAAVCPANARHEVQRERQVSLL